MKALYLLIVISSSLAWGRFAGGTGTVADPYQIANVEQLDSIRYFNKQHFVLNADLDLNVAPFNQGEGWIPIDYFTGSLNGRGHAIRNLFINAPSKNSLGFFDTIRKGKIDSLTLIGVKITGSGSIGAIAVLLDSTSTIAHTAATGEIIATGDGVGGLVGVMRNSPKIEDSYAVVNVSGGELVGGLVGLLTNATVTRCYSAGIVAAKPRNIGGLVGNTELSTYYQPVVVPRVEDTYFNMETSTLHDSQKGKGLTTAQMLSKASFKNWDFEKTWEIKDGEAYPSLQGLPSHEFAVAVENPDPEVATVHGNAQYFEGDAPKNAALAISDIVTGYTFSGWEVEGAIVSTSKTYSLPLSGFVHVKAKISKSNADFGGGFGTYRQPYKILTVKHLDNLRKYTTEKLEWALENDIDLDVSPYNSGEGWTPIPSFHGYLNGRGYAIKNMMINRPDSDSLGLFASFNGFTGLDSLGLLDFDIQGKGTLGGIAGAMDSYGQSIRNCYVSGKIRASKGDVGGMFGYVDGYSVIQHAAAAVDLQAIIGSVGGIVGSAQYGTEIRQSYSLGSLKSNDGAVGGILGYIYYRGGVYDNYSYATTEVPKCEYCYAGSIVGKISGADRDVQNYVYVERNYAARNTKVVGLNGGFFNVAPSFCFIPSNDSIATAMKKKATYYPWDFDAVWTIQEGKEYPRLQGNYLFDHPSISSRIQNEHRTRTNESLRIPRTQLYDLRGRWLGSRL